LLKRFGNQYFNIRRNTMGNGLGFEELAQAMRSVGNDMVTNTTTGINAIENIENSKVNRAKGLSDIATAELERKRNTLKLEEEGIALADKKRINAELNSPVTTSQVFGFMAGDDPTKRIKVANEMPKITSLLGWNIDPDDPNKPILKKDGTPVTMRDAGKAGNLISSYYSSTSNPLTTTQSAAETTKANLQKLLPEVDLGPGITIDDSILKKLHDNAGKLVPEVSQILGQVITAQNDYKYVNTHPREAWAKHIDSLTQLKAYFAHLGGDTSHVDADLKSAQDEYEKIPLGVKAAGITGMAPGTLLAPKDSTTIGGHVAGYNQGIDVENLRGKNAVTVEGMRDATSLKMDANRSDKENKVAVLNNYTTQLNAAAKQAQDDVAKLVELAAVTPNPISPDKANQMIAERTNAYQEQIHQNFYDVAGKSRIEQLGLQVHPSVDQSTPQIRSAQAPIIKDIGTYMLSMLPAKDSGKPVPPEALIIKTQLEQIEKARRSGDEQTSNNLLAELKLYTENIKKTKGENKNKAIVNGAKGLKRSWFNTSPDYGPSAIN
jgi:hypothetical protein